MPVINNLEKYYEKNLKAQFGRLEEKRRKVVRNIKLVWGIIGISILLIIIIFWPGFTERPLIFTLTLLAVSPVFFIIPYLFLKRGYRRDFKKQVIAPLVKFIDDSMIYDSKGYIPSKVFVESRIFRSSFNSYKGEDLVPGRIGQTDFMFSEVTVEKTDKEKDNERSTVFEGLFFVADFQKRFKGITLVEPQIIFETGDEAYREGIGRAVKLEDPEFEKEFNVFGSDHVESRYILSTSLMQRILNYKRKFGKPMYLSFVNSKVFIAIPSGGELSEDGQQKRIRFTPPNPLFEPPVFSPLKGFESCKKYLGDIQLVLDIIEDLKLNRRIWAT